MHKMYLIISDKKEPWAIPSCFYLESLQITKPFPLTFFRNLETVI